MIHICVCKHPSCGNLFMVEDLNECDHGHLSGKKVIPHAWECIESFEVKNEEVVVKHFFDLAKVRTGDIVVKIKTNDDFSERYRNYLIEEGNIRV